MNYLKKAALCSSVILLVSVCAAAQKEAAKAPSGYQAETIGQIDAAGKKLIQLAEAMPDETLAWRPSEKVRSSSEVYMHVAQANYFILGIAGIKPPGDLPEDMEKITAKADVIAHLKRSFEYTNGNIAKIPDEDLEKPVKLFGRDSTVRGVLLLLAVHSHEHLGQLIAYARTNNVTPPWSVPRSEGE